MRNATPVLRGTLRNQHWEDAELLVDGLVNLHDCVMRHCVIRGKGELHLYGNCEFTNVALDVESTGPMWDSAEEAWKSILMLLDAVRRGPGNRIVEKDGDA